MRLPNATVTFTTRQGGVSEGPYESLNLGALTEDVLERVVENRHRAAQQAGVAPERMAMGYQVHGTDLREWTEPPLDRAYAEPGGKELDRVDGHLTREPGVGLLVLVADCYPVALSDGEQAAMLHCGWRPLAAGMIEKALARFSSPPAAAVGPGIGGCCYEVGRRGPRAVRRRRRGRLRPDARPAHGHRREARGGRRGARRARRPLHQLRARAATSHTAVTTA